LASKGVLVACWLYRQGQPDQAYGQGKNQGRVSGD